MSKGEMRNNNNSNIHIEQINPRTELTDLEKTAILQFEIEQQEEELSRTQQFKLLNNKKSEKDEFDLPKRKISLGETIKINISDLRDAIETQNSIEIPKLKKKKSLYDTIIIKLDNLINKNDSLKRYKRCKVINIENINNSSKKIFIKSIDITKFKNFKVNVDSVKFNKQFEHLNKYALSYLCRDIDFPFRKVRKVKKLKGNEKINLEQNSFINYHKELTEFAVNRLYNRCIPKETTSYKIYKYSIMFFLITLLGSCGIIFNWYIQGLSTNKLSSSLIQKTQIEELNTGNLYNFDINANSNKIESEEEKDMYWRYIDTPLSSVNLNDLIKQNKDTIGWLIVKNTNVNYPVVQTTNNEFYLKHSFDRSKNNAGWVFADYRDDFKNLRKNTIIYAHGRKDKVMFGSLTDTLKKDWYTDKDNQIIQLSTKYYNTMWQIVSIYKIKAESYYITTDFESDNEFLEFAETMVSRSIYNFNVPISEDDRFLTLSTCYNDNGVRLVVQAKLVKIQAR